MVDSADTIEVKISELIRLVDQNLEILGLNVEERETVSNVLMYAELRGKSQGLIKILEKTVVPAADRTPLVIDQKTPSINLVLGNGNIGMVVLNTAVKLTIEACQHTGLALTGTRGTSSSTGSIGYYAEKVAAAGFIGIVSAGSPKVMAVCGSVKRALGTNPLSIALPTGNHPLVLDMATAATTWFDIIRCQRENIPLPEGVALDSEGRATVDPGVALQGVMKTFAGSKGSGLALMLEMLTGPLMGASIVDDGTDNRGNFILAINPSVFVDNFADQVEAILDAIRRGPHLPGIEAIRLPGEHADQLAFSQLTAGTATINRQVFDELSMNLAD